MAKQIIKRGGGVLVRYPFTDLSGSKVRPALILTPDHLLLQMNDVLCLFISTTIPLDLLPTDIREQSTRHLLEKQLLLKIAFWLLALGLLTAFGLIIFRPKI